MDSSKLLIKFTNKKCSLGLSSAFSDIKSIVNTLYVCRESGQPWYDRVFQGIQKLAYHISSPYLKSWRVCEVGLWALGVVEGPVADGAPRGANGQTAAVEQVTAAVSVLGCLVH